MFKLKTRLAVMNAFFIITKITPYVYVVCEVALKSDLTKGKGQKATAA